MKEPSKILLSLLKVLSMFNIGIWYDTGNVIEDFGINCIKCNEVVGYYLEDQTLNKGITVLVTSVAFQHVGISCIIQSKEQLKFGFEYHCYNWILNGKWYNTTIFTLSCFII